MQSVQRVVHHRQRGAVAARDRLQLGAAALPLPAGDERRGGAGGECLGQVVVAVGAIAGQGDEQRIGGGGAGIHDHPP